MKGFNANIAFHFRLVVSGLFHKWEKINYNFISLPNITFIYFMLYHIIELLDKHVTDKSMHLDCIGIWYNAYRSE